MTTTVRDKAREGADRAALYDALLKIGRAHV
jgi:hypothetical protein